ncbi:MAG: diaminopimelate epimerase [Alistipes sp.]|nr:diaminopimelate epimerase [Alistipes sp.]
MLSVKYIRCHGSGNRFLMLDAVAHPQLEALADHPALIEVLCTHKERMDGLLLTVRVGNEYGMRMFNTDGSEAEMCGNGIRCVARQAQAYVGEKVAEFPLWSGGVRHAIHREEPIYGSIPTYRVDIRIQLTSADFPSAESEGWIGRPIAELDSDLRFTFLNLGNPHLTAECAHIDLDTLTRLGEQVKTLPELLPHGVNVSLFRHIDEEEIYTATYERGVGLTSSCGTAMTACSTTACLLGLCRTEHPIRVRNSGGMVRCCCHRKGASITTSLSGNATYEAEGVLTLDIDTECIVGMEHEEPCQAEIAQYEAFLKTIQ